MLSDATIKLLELAGVWLSALATFAAVVVSLWLARTSNRVRLETFVSHVLMITPGEDYMPEYVSFRVTNIGMRTANLQGIGWESGIFNWGPFKKKYALQRTDGYSNNPRLPIKLGDGEVANYLIQLIDDEDNFYRHFQSFVPNWVYRKTLRAIAYTSSGETFKVRPSQSFFDKMEKTLNPDAQETPVFKG